MKTFDKGKRIRTGQQPTALSCFKQQCLGAPKGDIILLELQFIKNENQDCCSQLLPPFSSYISHSDRKFS